jgi:hypothetical protein
VEEELAKRERVKQVATNPVSFGVSAADAARALVELQKGTLRRQLVLPAPDVEQQEAERVINSHASPVVGLPLPLTRAIQDRVMEKGRLPYHVRSKNCMGGRHAACCGFTDDAVSPHLICICDCHTPEGLPKWQRLQPDPRLDYEVPW